MYTKVVLATTLLASAASASNFMAHPQMKRDILEARQTDITDISTECQSAILEVYTSIPTPPPAIIDDMLSNPQTDPCSFSTPASLSKEYASYSSEVVSWASAHEDEISSVLSQCPALSQYATMVPVCETGLGGSSDATATGDSDSATKTGDADSKTATGTAADKTTAAASGASGTASGTATGTGAAASQTTNAAHRETGMAFVAAAAAGFIGVVAAL